MPWSNQGGGWQGGGNGPSGQGPWGKGPSSGRGGGGGGSPPDLEEIIRQGQERLKSIFGGGGGGGGGGVGVVWFGFANVSRHVALAARIACKARSRSIASARASSSGFMVSDHSER